MDLTEQEWEDNLITCYYATSELIGNKYFTSLSEPEQKMITQFNGHLKNYFNSKNGKE